MRVGVPLTDLFCRPKHNTRADGPSNWSGCGDRRSPRWEMRDRELPAELRARPRQLKGSVTVRVALVSCVKEKRPFAAPACDLYTSQLFRALREYAISRADDWYVLSAEYGLLRPDQTVAP